MKVISKIENNYIQCDHMIPLLIYISCSNYCD